MIRLQNITKHYAGLRGKATALDRLSLTIKSGEFVTILGPNGAGKSTLLYLLAGLDQPNEGEITHAQSVSSKRNIGFVFQNYTDSLLPWKTALANISLPLVARGIGLDEAHKQGQSMVNRLGLEALTNKYPYQLSGGQKQLVALARAFATEPELLLLDEPTSSLDYFMSQKVIAHILSYWEKHRMTAICVSHNIDEAILLSDRIIILSKQGGVAADIPVKLPRPRSLKQMASIQFFAYRQKILAEI